ncbi:hypothetical protein [Virgibacillus sp. DJP39]
MKKVTGGLTKFFVANLTVLLSIMLLPVFLITDDIAVFEQIMEYLFKSKE